MEEKNNEKLGCSVKELIGKGGFGLVYKAEDSKTKEMYALHVCSISMLYFL